VPEPAAVEVKPPTATKTSAEVATPATPAETLVRSWASESKHRRPLPRSVRLGLAGAGGLFALLLVGSRCGSSEVAQTSVALHEQLVVHEAELRERTEATADDFAARKPASFQLDSPTPATSREVATNADTDSTIDRAAAIDLAKRRRQRADDPEDVRTRKRARKASGTAAQAAERPYAPVLYDFTQQRAARDKPERARAGLLIRAGDTLRARLARPIEVGRGGATVVATVRLADTSRARLLGAARRVRSGVGIRFRKLVLPGGPTVRVEAEAQSGGGSVIAGKTSSKASAPRRASRTARSVGRGLVRGALGTGLAGDMARDALDSNTPLDSRSRFQADVTVSLPASAAFEVLFLSDVPSPNQEVQ
jgi:hypothetical protein